MNRLSNDPAVRLAECRGEAVPARDDFRKVSIVVLLAACNVIEEKGDQPEILAELRRYTFGDLSSAPAFDESAERVKFEVWYAQESAAWPTSIAKCCYETLWKPWLASAKSRAEVK